MASPRTSILAAVALAVVGAVLGVAAWRKTAAPPVVPSASPGSGDAPRTRGSGTHSTPPAPEPSRAAPPPKDRARADELRRTLAALRGERAAAPSAGAPSVGSRPEHRAPSAGAEAPEMPAPVGSGNQVGLALGNYVKSVVHEQFGPMAGDCYGELLARTPAKRGRLVLSVTVVGDPSVGGVVESVEPAKGTTLDDESFTTCVVESMMSVQFAAPPEGHDKVDFTYPFEFAPSEPGER